MEKKNLIFKVLIILLMSLLVLTGCGADDDDDDDRRDRKSRNKNETENVIENEQTEPEQTEININRAEDFKDGIAVVTETINFEGTHYVIDKNFKVLSTYKGNSTYIDGYMQIEDKTDERKTNIVDTKGNVVFSYTKDDYTNVELVAGGCIVTTKQTDTYNSSNTVTGIYDLSAKKYVLEPAEKYVNKTRTYGDNMVVIDDDYKEFFNTKTKTVVTYTERVPREFKDGYAVEEHSSDNSLTFDLQVFDDKGNVKILGLPYENIVYGREHENGMLFEVTSYVFRDESDNERIRTYCSIFNLETGETIDLSGEFWMVTNKPHFTEEGYALVTFSNQGGTNYCTVIDRKGNKQFEPVQISTNNSLLSGYDETKIRITSDNLESGKYMIAIDNNKTIVLDKDNKVVLEAEENETFEGITNNSVKVTYKEPGKLDVHYYKDLSGKKISIHE